MDAINKILIFTFLIRFVNSDLNKLEKLLIYLVTCNKSEFCTVVDFGNYSTFFAIVDQPQHIELVAKN